MVASSAFRWKSSHPLSFIHVKFETTNQMRYEAVNVCLFLLGQPRIGWKNSCLFILCYFFFFKKQSEGEFSWGPGCNREPDAFLNLCWIVLEFFDSATGDKAVQLILELPHINKHGWTYASISSPAFSTIYSLLWFIFISWEGYSKKYS